MSEIIIQGRRFLGMVIISAMALGGNSAFAQQITPDKTLPNNSSVKFDGKIWNITDGTRAGNNLFHSFKEFSVGTGQEAHFNNATDIQNIISRVTGSSRSEIDGLIKVVQGNANLFLINPHGIVFGPYASLSVGGSFVASTANSLKFADGTEFSATNPQTTPLLTVSVPIGLQFGPNPGPIKVYGAGHQIDYDNLIKYDRKDSETSADLSKIDTTSFKGLQVQPGKTLALVGGEISLEGGILTSPAGRIEIGSVGSNQVVNIDSVEQGFKLGYERPTNFGDIHLSKRALLNTTGNGSGTIAIAGRKINLSGQSILLADTQGNQNGGEISIFGDSIDLNQSSIRSYTSNSGNAGQIKFEAKNIKIEDSLLSGRTTENSTGRAGNINFNVADLLDIKSTPISTDTNGTGNAGKITISAKSFQLSNRNNAFSSVTNSAGNAGKITIKVNGPLLVSDGGSIVTETNGTGNAGKINISANSFQMENGRVSSSAKENSTGNAGKIDIKVADIFKINNTSVQSNTFGSGASGELTVQASTLVIEGFFQTSSDGISTAGKLKIIADIINIKNKNEVSATNNGKFAVSNGNGGDITLHVAKLLLLENGSSISTTADNAGNGGNITIEAPNGFIVGVPVLGNNNITANAFNGSGGKIKIKALGVYNFYQRSLEDLKKLLGTNDPSKLDPKNLPTNDISAISRTSPTLEGLVQIKTPDIDPSRGLVQLPKDVVNTPKLVARGCAAFSDEGGSKFIVTGRGGLPPSPDEPLTNDVVWTDTRIPITTLQQHSSNKPKAKPKAKPIVISPAIGWVFNGKGDVTLISSTHGVNNLGTTPANCSGN